uniref:UDP-glucosyltransferase UGT79F1 n=1 Tax=Polygala tenuifolia TaxID=355332 RepID=A0A3G3NBF3_9FABA|nr:UDP-glucosyltransferase UGT79F1 [Polygala tenuifolia]
MDSNKTMHIAMSPWFAFGHFIPYLQLSNKLAEKGHRISFFVPKGAISKIQHGNLHPNLIAFVPINVPQVEGLPSGAETTADISVPQFGPSLATAMDRTKTDIQLFLHQLNPDFVFFDFAYWIPSLAKSLGIKSIQFTIASVPTIARNYSIHVKYYQVEADDISDEDLMKHPPGYPDSSLIIHPHEVKMLRERKKMVFGSGLLFYDRLLRGLRESDAIAYRSCRELDGPILDYMGSQFGKTILPTGPLIPKFPASDLDEKWTRWLGGFKAGSVIYSAFGSETTLSEDQFHELLLGLEQTGMPFLVVHKLPTGFESVKAALPEGFLERVEGRGIVHDGWVPQQKILEHPSVGCFVSHCGYSSLLEALPNDCQLVLMPIVEYVTPRRLSSVLKVAVEVEAVEADGFFSKESVCKAVRTAMDVNSEAGKEIRANRAKVREIFLNKKFESSYIESFCQKLGDILVQ